MDQRELLKILKSVESGTLSPERAVERLKNLPFEDLGFAKVDHHRALRQGYAEVVFGKGKTPAQVAEIELAADADGTITALRLRPCCLGSKNSPSAFPAC